jgi:hypothetical protein
MLKQTFLRFECLGMLSKVAILFRTDVLNLFVSSPYDKSLYHPSTNRIQNHYLKPGCMNKHLNYNLKKVNAEHGIPPWWLILASCTKCPGILEIPKTWSFPTRVIPRSRSYVIAFRAMVAKPTGLIEMTDQVVVSKLCPLQRYGSVRRCWWDFNVLTYIKKWRGTSRVNEST